MTLRFTTWYEWELNLPNWKECRLSAVWYDTAGNPMDLSGHEDEISWSIRSRIYSFSGIQGRGLTFDAPNGAILLTVAAVDMARFRPDTYAKHTLRMGYDDDYEELLRGSVYFRDD